jgi:hypothetical protein
MSDLSPSDIKTDAEWEKLIAEAPTAEMIKKLCYDRAVEQGLVGFDAVGAMVPLDKPAATETVTATININGVEKKFTGKDSADLDRQQIEYFRSLENAQAAPRDEKGRFTADQGKADEAAAAAEEARQNELVRRSRLEIEFRSGRLSSADYLAQTGAIEEHLAAQGIDLESLKEQAAEKAASKAYEQTWAEATTKFLKSPEGADWPGGEENLARMADIIKRIGEVNPDIEKEDKTAVLAHCWGIMKRNDKQIKDIESATSVEDIRAAIRGDSSSLFNR